MTDSLISGGGIKFCPRCGQQMKAESRACPSCGQQSGSDKTKVIIIVVVVVALGMLAIIPVIGILAAIALPNFIGAQDKAREAGVKANMRTAQIATESYAIDHDGKYPTAVNAELKSYYPGGVQPSTAGRAPINPFTNEAEWPITGHITDVASSREAAPGTLGKGVVEYSVIFTGNHEATSYAIRGGGAHGQVLSGRTGTSLVLSNQ